MKDLKLAIIGTGNIGSSIAEGILKTGQIKPENIMVTDQRNEPLEYFKTKGLKTSSSNLEAIEFADAIILSVKPHFVRSVLTEINPYLQTDRHIIISIAAGINIFDIESIIGKIPIFRVMPNIAIAIQESMTCIAESHTSKEQQKMVISLFSLLGKAVMIPEDLIMASTVLGSSGTAFALRFIRANMEGGIEMGFTPELAGIIAAQAALGAAKMILMNGTHPEVEIDKVTTPKGITIAGLNEMEQNGFSSSIMKGIMKAFEVKVKK